MLPFDPGSLQVWFPQSPPQERWRRRRLGEASNPWPPPLDPAKVRAEQLLNSVRNPNTSPALRQAQKLLGSSQDSSTGQSKDRLQRDVPVGTDHPSTVDGTQTIATNACSSAVKTGTPARSGLPGGLGRGKGQIRKGARETYERLLELCARPCRGKVRMDRWRGMRVAEAVHLATPQGVSLETMDDLFPGALRWFRAAGWPAWLPGHGGWYRRLADLGMAVAPLKAVRPLVVRLLSDKRAA